MPDQAHFVGCKSHLSKTLKDIGKKQDIALQVDVMVVSKCLTVKGFPDIFRVLVVLIACCRTLAWVAVAFPLALQVHQRSRRGKHPFEEEALAVVDRR